MSSVHIAHNIQKSIFGRFTRKSMQQTIFDEACKENKTFHEVMKPAQCALKELFPKAAR